MLRPSVVVDHPDNNGEERLLIAWIARRQMALIRVVYMAWIAQANNF